MLLGENWKRWIKHNVESKKTLKNTLTSKQASVFWIEILCPQYYPILLLVFKNLCFSPKLRKLFKFEFQLYNNPPFFLRNKNFGATTYYLDKTPMYT